jgi:hypothetical protein
MLTFGLELDDEYYVRTGTRGLNMNPYPRRNKGNGTAKVRKYEGRQP